MRTWKNKAFLVLALYGLAVGVSVYAADPPKKDVPQKIRAKPRLPNRGRRAIRSPR